MHQNVHIVFVLTEELRVCVSQGVPQRQPHRRSGLATLPYVGAIP